MKKIGLRSKGFLAAVFVLLCSLTVFGGNVIVKNGQVNLSAGDLIVGDDLFVDVSEGKVGIGTTSPAVKLEVVGDVRVSADEAFIARYTSNDNYRGLLQWQGLQLGNNGQNLIVAGNTQTGGYLDFVVNNANDLDGNPAAHNGEVAMTLQSDGDVIMNGGNVGVGTTEPTNKLHVEGDNIRLVGSAGTIKLEAGGQTGISRVGTGVQDISIDSTGNVGVGTADPEEKLEINGNLYLNDGFIINGGTYSGLYSDTSDGSDTKRVMIASGGGGSPSRGAYLYMFGNEFTSGLKGKVEIYSGNAGNSVPGDSDIALISGVTNEPAIYVEGSSGNVGVGMTGPSEKLEVDGTVKATAFVGNGSGLTGISGGDASYGSSVSSPDDAVYVDDAGSVGIGTAAPTRTLEVNGNVGAFDSNNKIAIVAGTNADPVISTDSSTSIGLLAHGGLLAQKTFNGVKAGAYILYNSGSSGGGDALIVNAVSTDSNADIVSFQDDGTERFKVTRAGNVGIGTASPQSILSIGGSNPVISTDTTDVGGHTKRLTLQGSGGLGDAGAIYLYGNDYTVAANRGDIQIVAGDTGNEDISFYTDNTQNRMIIKEGGNVGIGASNPGEKLTVAGTVESTSGGFKFPDGTTQTTAVQKYDSGWFSASAGTTYTKAHGLGAVPDIVELWYSDTSDGSGDVVVGGQLYSYARYGAKVVDIDDTEVKVRARTYLAAYYNADGTAKTPTSGYLKVKAILL